jgi:glycolate oxidase FAD binding subunit
MADATGAETMVVFADSIPPARVRDGTHVDAVDGRVPPLVAAPRGLEDVVALVSAARRERLSMVCAGGRTLLSIGNPPLALDAVVDTGSMSAVLESRPEDMTVTVEAGITLADLARVLAENRQRIALDAADPSRATLGGLVAANAAGGLAYAFGTPRDLVLGMSVVDGRARALRVGGRVVKNVAGYELTRLFTGSYGTLAVIVDLTLRTHPLPDLAMTLKYSFPTGAQLDRARAAIFSSELAVAGFDFELDDTAATESWSLVLRIEGTAGEVEYQMRRSAELCAGGACDQRPDWISPFHPSADEDVVVRVGTEPDGMVAVAQALRAAAAGRLRIAGRLGDGTLRACACSDGVDDALLLASTLRSCAAAAGASTLGERLPPSVKGGFDVWGAPPSGFALMREIKKRFDPDGVLAPGRFVGGL